MIHGKNPQTSWRPASADLWAGLASVLFGLLIAIEPHLVWWLKTGHPIWIADHDDLDVYLLLGGHAYWNHPLRITDPISQGASTMFPSLELVPGVVVARVLGLSPIYIGLVWRALAGAFSGLAWYAVFRKFAGMAAIAVGLALLMLADAGLLRGYPLVVHFLRIFQISTGRTADLFATKPLIFPAWRVMDPGLTLGLLLFHVLFVYEAIKKPRAVSLAFAGISFGVLFTFFYYWTAAAGALLIAALIDWDHWRVYAKTLCIGGVFGAPFVIASAMLKAATSPDWLLRNDIWLNINHFSELLIPKGAIIITLVCLPYIHRRRPELRHLWSLIAAALLLENHQMITGLQNVNFHWSGVWAPMMSLLLVLLAVPLLSEAAARSPSWSWLIWGAVTAVCVSGLWMRGVEAVRTTQSVALTAAADRYYSAKSLRTAKLKSGCIVAGDAVFMSLAGIFQSQRPFSGYWADLSPYIDNSEWRQRMAINAILLGSDRADFETEQRERLQHDPVGPWQRAPNGRAIELSNRMAAYDSVRRHFDTLLSSYGACYVGLPSGTRLPISGWRENEAGPGWDVWEDTSTQRQSANSNQG